MNRTVCSAFVVSLCAGWLNVAIAAAADAQPYPVRPIRLIVPWPPGGGVDIAARTIGPKLSESLAQSVVVDNRAGAAGMIGAQFAAKAPADGYTILLASAGPNAILPLLVPKPPYDALKDFAEVSLFAYTVYVMVVNPRFPANSIAELVAAAKAKPGELTIGSAGTATPAHISGELFRSAAGVNMTAVPYKGAAAPVLDVAAGQITMAIETISPILPLVRTGKLKALGVTSSRRSGQLPDVPTIAESGYPGFDVVNWYGVLAPAGTPQYAIAKLNQEITRIVSSPDTRERLVSYGLEVVTSTPQDYAAFRKSDLAKWARIIKEINLRYE
jgi:tripartite-type tricarboxylate transporter receptor subunit TctC